ncbi:P1 family peptidase [bacterium]|nr:P1 family peptidase [bacterium]
MQPGTLNAITDVAGVLVGHTTVIEGSDTRTGVTAVLPHAGNLFMNKVPAAVYTANGFGKLTGVTQIEELGEIETPVILTNTLSVPAAADAVLDYTLANPENAGIRSINPVVGETNDGWLNDIRGRHISKEDVIDAIKNASGGPVQEGSVGAGTGTVCFGYKGGIGTASRMLPASSGGYTVGVLVQTNYGGSLRINGVPVARQLAGEEGTEAKDGSCMIIVATDAPLDTRNLKRLAKRAVFGLARTGGTCSNGSGEYVIAFTTAASLSIPFQSRSPLQTGATLRNDRMTPLFSAVIEATEEAILNSLFTAISVTGYQGHTVSPLPVQQVLAVLRRHRMAE